MRLLRLFEEQPDPRRPWRDARLNRGGKPAPIQPDGSPFPEQINRIRQIRDDVRAEEGETTGMCHLVSEVIENEFGWDRWGGVYTASSGDMICSAHLFNVLPNGALLDATADQFGEGHDIRVIQPDDPEYQRYRMEWMQDYNPDLSDDYPELHGVEWSGEYDSEAQNRLRAERGDRWWINEGAGPRFTKNSEGLYDFFHPGFGVYAVVDIADGPGGKVMVIYEFSSNDIGKGNARAALQYLRGKFSHITVQDIGYSEADSSWRFWMIMAKNKLVDELYADDEVTPVYQDGKFLR